MAIKDATASPRTAEPQGSSLYEVIKGIDFEKRELLGKPRGRGLFDLVARPRRRAALLRLHAVRAHLPDRLHRDRLLPRVSRSCRSTRRPSGPRP